MACLLILEDDNISARLAARMLQTHGHEVHLAERSAVAWARLQDSAIDALFLDTQLGDEHGWEFLARVRGDFVLKELPVIVYSSVAQREVVQRYLALGVQGILVKPATAERLNQEADRVTRTPWRKKLFEPEEAVQARTGLLPAETARLYLDAAEQLRSALPELAGLAHNPADARGLARLTALKSCALNIGYLRLAQMLDAAHQAATAKNAAQLKALLDRLPAALQLLVIHAGGHAAQVVQPMEAPKAAPPAADVPAPAEATAEEGSGPTEPASVATNE